MVSFASLYSAVLFQTLSRFIGGEPRLERPYVKYPVILVGIRAVFSYPVGSLLLFPLHTRLTDSPCKSQTS